MRLFRLLHRCAGRSSTSHEWLLQLAIAVRTHHAALHEFLAGSDGWDVLVSMPFDPSMMHRALHRAIGCCRGHRLRTIEVPPNEQAVLATIVELAIHRPADGGWGITSQILAYGERLPIRVPETSPGETSAPRHSVVQLELRRPGIAPDRTDSELRRVIRLRCSEAALACRTRGRRPVASHT